MNMKRMGVIGLANMGERRLQRLARRADVEIAALCTRDQALLARRSREYHVARITTDWRELVADSSLDGLCICTPNNLHHVMATTALRAGLTMPLSPACTASTSTSSR